MSRSLPPARAARAARISLTVVLWLMIATVAGVGAAARLAPLAGHEMLAIRSGSMAPAIPIGAMVAVDTSGSRTPRPGDAIAYRLPSGHIVVHRFVEPAADGTSLVTRGDANATADPLPVPRDRLLGTVTWQLPAAGFLLGMLGMASGLLTIVAVGGALLCAIWLVEDLEAELAAGPAAPAPGTAPAAGRVTATWSKADTGRGAGLGHPARRLR